MEMPRRTLARETLLDTYGEHHEATLGADASAKDIAAQFTAQQSDLRASLEARKAAEHLVTRAEALAFGAETEAEQIIRQVEGALLSGTGKRRDVDPYKAVFPGGLTSALAPRAEGQSKEGSGS